MAMYTDPQPKYNHFVNGVHVDFPKFMSETLR